jgi:hypothetical protein
MHGSKEEWARLIWIADAAELMRGSAEQDWAAVFARADDARVRRMLLIGLALAHDLLGAPLPPPASTALTSDREARSLAAMAAKRLLAHHGDAPSVYHLSGFRLRMRERWGDRVHYVAATLLTARATFSVR